MKTIKRCTIHQCRKDRTLYTARVEKSTDGGKTWEWCSTLEGINGMGVKWTDAVAYGKQYAGNNVVGV